MEKVLKKIILIAIFVFSSLIYFDVQIAGVELYTALILLCCFFELAISIMDGGIASKVELIKSKQLISLAIFSLFLVELLRLFYIAYLNISNSERSFNNPLIILSIIGLMVASKGFENVDIRKYETFSILCLPVFILNAVYLETGNELISETIPIVEQNDMMAVYITIFLTLLGIGIEKTKRPNLKCLYIILLLVGYTELILTVDWVCICVLILYYLAIPAFRLPTKYLISLYMKQLFLLLFMISNISLITGYTDFFASKVYLPLEASIYIDVILIICATIFFSYWEKVPEKVDPDRLILKKMRTGFKIAALTYSCILLAMIIGADRLIVPADSDVGGFRLALSIVASDVRNRGNIMTSMIADGDAIGLILIILIISMMIYKAVKNISFYKPRLSSFALISCVFVILLLTTEVNANVAAIGVLILISAAYGEEPRQTYTIRKFNYDTDIENDNRGLEEQDELSIKQN